MHIVSNDFASMSMLVGQFTAQVYGLDIHTVPALRARFYHGHDGIFCRLPVEGMVMILILLPVWHFV